MLKIRSVVSGGIALVAGLLACHTAQAGVNYTNPAGGWRYSYEANPFSAGTVSGNCAGGVCPPGFGLGGSTPDALDGTWTHNQGDKWDGSAPGAPLGDYHAPPANPVGNPRSGNQGIAPGGAGIFSESGTSYFRIQDVGNPEDTNYAGGTDTFYNGYVQGNIANPVGPSQPMNSNRRVYFGHPIRPDGTLTDELILTDTGVTLSFRARIPGIDQDAGLDDIHQQDTDMDGNLNVTPWFQDAPYGRGAPMVNGRGTINVAQNAPDNLDTSVGFSLVTSNDITAFCGGSSGALCTGSGSGGLIMNNLNGNSPTNVDSASAGTLNILEMPDEDLNEWHEFWITMANNGALAGNMEVKVYMDGDVSNPSTFQVTLSGATNAVYKDENDPFLEMGFSADAFFGSIDLDFVSYSLGVIAPVAAGLPGDHNGDDVVDAADYVAWRKTDGGNQDGYDDFFENFGESALGSGGSGTVPEPSSVCLASLIALSLVGMVRPRRRCA